MRGSVSPASPERRRPAGARYACVALAVAIAGLACREERPTLRLGLLPTRSGDFAASGRAVVAAARLAVAHANRAGVIVAGQRHQLELKTAEAPPQPEAALAAAQGLLNRERVAALIGPNLSNVALPVAEAAQRAGVPMVSPGASHPDVTRDRPFVFRVVAVDRIQGRAMARFAREDLSAARAAVLYDRAAPYNTDMASVFRDEFEARGGQVSAFESYVTGDTDFTAPFEAIRRAGADVVYLPNYPSDLLAQAQQARDVALSATLLGPGSWSLLALADHGALFEGSYHSSNWNHDVDGGTSRAFVRAYRAANGETPVALAALTYDAVRLVADAAARAPALDGASLARALAATRDYVGVTGTLRFDADGDPVKPTAIVHLHGGRAAFFKWIAPQAEPARP